MQKEKLRLLNLGKKQPPRSKEWRVKLADARRGEKSHFWKGGVSKVNDVIRNSVEYKLWRESVLKRDNFICQDCGIKQGWNKQTKSRAVMQAHHIKPFALFPELRFAIDNGITLCISCHKKTDTYGKNFYTK